MTGSTPPYPKLVLPKSKLLRRLMLPWLAIRARSCSIAMIPESAYRAKVNQVRLPGHTVLFPTDPDTVRQVLVDDADAFPKAVMVADVLGLLMGDSIFVSNGDVWRRQRRMMNPAFEHTRVKIVFGLMAEAAEAMIARLDPAADGRDLDIQEEMTFVTADIIFRTIFSRPLEKHEAAVIFHAFNDYQEAAYAHGLNRQMRLPEWMSALRYRRARRAAAAIRAVLDPMVALRHASFHAGEPQVHNDILQSLVSVKDDVTGSHFDVRELCEQVAMLFLAGHETSASALSWTLFLLAGDQTSQDRAHVEVDTALGQREIAFSDLRKLGFIRNVFAESMRLYPPVPYLPRQASKVCPIRNFMAKPGTIVSISPWLVHRQRSIWANPDSFDPDRFDRPETKDAERQCYIPFSKGPRVCLGASFAQQEASIILASLLRRYHFAAVPGFSPQLRGRLTVRSVNGIRLRVTRRPSIDAI